MLLPSAQTSCLDRLLTSALTYQQRQSATNMDNCMAATPMGDAGTTWSQWRSLLGHSECHRLFPCRAQALMHKHCRQQEHLSSQCNMAHHVPGSACFQVAICCHELTPKTVIPNTSKAAFAACANRSSLAIINAWHIMVVGCMITQQSFHLGKALVLFQLVSLMVVHIGDHSIINN